MASQDLRRGRGAGRPSPARSRTRWPPAASATPSCSPARAGWGRRRPRASWPRPSTARRATAPTAEPCGECALLRRDRGRDVARRAGDRRRHPQRRRAGARAARERALQPGPRPLQDLDHRRGPHALDGSVQRAPEDARGAAAAREVHLRDDRVPQDPGHDPLALPAVRLPPDPRPRAGDAPAAGGGRRRHHGLRRHAGPPGPRRGRQRARRPVASSTRCSRSAGRPCATRTSPPCSASSTASCCWPPRAPWPRATAWPLELVERLSDYGADYRNFTRELILHFREILLLKVAPGESVAHRAARPRGARAAARRWRPRSREEDLLRIFEVLAKAETDLRLAQDPRVTLEMALLKIVQMQRLLPFADLVARVERLAGGVRAPLRRRGRRRSPPRRARCLVPSRAGAAPVPRPGRRRRARRRRHQRDPPPRPPRPHRRRRPPPAAAATATLADGRMRCCRRWSRTRRRGRRSPQPLRAGRARVRRARRSCSSSRPTSRSSRTCTRTSTASWRARRRAGR